ncbi:Coagulation factor 5/8 type domain-containing protein [Myceligenerans xiligouense]|uniref:Membrane dipeptidase (Peptidase family M19) n=1 Tax=Myceligenerans xiligouense TaxID=253184 RepID=A0A3N4ZGI6_9MICO|nr:Coagulation factor 5/8 type domain-containing protein [Myceligenerans xiligouense]RPF19965.1 hypothetical protein EDD34_0539 [Myceligenerans xiligouense]
MRRPRRTAALTITALVAVLSAATFAAPATGAVPDPVLPTPESEVNVTGEPFTGTAPDGGVRGYVDAHSHMFMEDGIGGAAVCGSAFSPAGIADALRDCDAHGPHGGTALLENLTRHGSPFGTHDTTGWPTFADWPAHDSLTHQQMYYRWVERSWRAGQRVLVNQLTSNGLLCSINPGTYQDCDEMAAIRLQIEDAYALQDFVDAQYGGPGEGWFRIVTDSAQARQVVTEGKLAVVLGVETSEPFGCKQTLRVFDGCTRSDISAGLDELYDLGVRSMFVCHKFDNALCGVRFDTGSTGTIVNAGQFLSTGTFWQVRSCPADEPHDNNPGNIDLPEELDWLPVPPRYPSGTVCNPYGLTSKGEYLVEELMERGMLIEVDHMSAKAADRTLGMLEEAGYGGVLSTHSWTDERHLDRIYALGGFATMYGHDTEGLIAEYERTADVRARHDVAGVGFGFDMNGFGGTPDPSDGRVAYPFTSLDGGSTLERQVTGERTWDVNTDGVAHYGLVPDYLEDLRVTGGEVLTDDVLRGAEYYLRTWESAESASP